MKNEKEKCGAQLKLPKHGVFKCQMRAGHKLKHVSILEHREEVVKITWVTDDRRKKQ